ncbi:unnamed protein product [Phaedon cochleariae]|uniref:RING-CH-type domain-containing protein n=1 Tax=Phaedon cochleariae TaxID=80249 RepID=A0A9N9WXE7_PHACE|nr:unnamed protein product [Phaedon cochleariae]
MIRHLLIMSGLSSSCSRDCSGRGECYNGTCLCDIRFTGELCDGPNLPYHTGIGGVFFFISIVCAIQLITCIISEYVRLKAPSLLRACKVTTQKLIYFVICIASLIRGAYFIFPESFEYGWSSSLLSSYYPLLMSSASLIVCFWAEPKLVIPDVDRGRTDPRNVLAIVVGIEDSDFYKLANKNGTLKQLFTRNQFAICKEKFITMDEISAQEISVFHLPGIRWDKPQFLSKSFLAFITFNVISFSLLIAETITTQLAKPPPDDPRFYHHLFNGCYAVLMFIIVVFFLIYGVEVYFKVRGGFITKPLQLASNNLETQPLRDEPDLRNRINLSQLHQSRIGLLSQALMLIIISGFLFSETLSEFWKTKIPINSRNFLNIVIRGRPLELLAAFRAEDPQFQHANLSARPDEEKSRFIKYIKYIYKEYQFPGNYSAELSLPFTISFYHPCLASWFVGVPINSRNLHNIIFRVVEIGVAVWFPAVLWNCMQPSELWILNPSKLLSQLERPRSGEAAEGGVKVDSDDEAFLDKRECWICYDGDKKEQLIQPCDCTGDVSSVHHECLRRLMADGERVGQQRAAPVQGVPVRVRHMQERRGEVGQGLHGPPLGQHRLRGDVHVRDGGWRLDRHPAVRQLVRADG